MDPDLLARLSGAPDALADIGSGRLDPRVASLLHTLLRAHDVRLGYVKTGHPMGATTPKGTANAHFFFCAVDIHAVDGAPVEARPIPRPVVDVGRMIISLPPKLRPEQVMGPAPWHAALGRSAVTGFRDDDHANAVHHDHLHLGFTPAASPQ